ncbi:MAG: hypothetical protein ICV79_12190, partial [Flavisolibacter sp.]|nr:hypothetical protein [Flavisolibacter sp.]
MATIKIFLASSLELKEDRQQFEEMIGRRNKLWQPKGVWLELFICEDGLDALSQTRSQDEYNKEIRNSDIFVMLFFNKVGKFSKEEFDTALNQFRATGKPIIFTYFKNVLGSIGIEYKEALTTLWAFQQELRDLGHFTSEYTNTDALKVHFTHQLEELANQGVIKLNEPTSAKQLLKELTLTLPKTDP